MTPASEYGRPEYAEIGATHHPFPPAQVTLYECSGCGSVVSDKDRHDRWHGWAETVEIDCPDCWGSGDIAQAVDFSDAVGCPNCDSTGRITSLAGVRRPTMAADTGERTNG